MCLIHTAIAAIASKTAIDVDSASIKQLASQYGKYNNNTRIRKASKSHQRNMVMGRCEHRRLLIL